MMEVAADRARNLVKELSTLQADLAAIDRAFKLHSIQVDTDLITPIRSFSGRIGLPHGELTRSILSCLRQSGKVPLSSHEIAMFVSAHVAALNGVEMDFKLIHERVGYRLRCLLKERVVQRHHNPKRGGEFGRWSLMPATEDSHEVHHTP